MVIASECFTQIVAPHNRKKSIGTQKITPGPGPGTQEDGSRVASFPARNNYYVKLD